MELLTEMQEFSLNVLKDNKERGVNGSYLGTLWAEHKHHRYKASSRDCFGTTAAAYRALRFLVKKGLARLERSSTPGGYTVETYYPA